MGDCMEVMVKVTKKALKLTVKDRLFTEEALSTFLLEVESIINSRPLACVRGRLFIILSTSKRKVDNA